MAGGLRCGEAEGEGDGEALGEVGDGDFGDGERLGEGVLGVSLPGLEGTCSAGVAGTVGVVVVGVGVVVVGVGVLGVVGVVVDTGVVGLEVPVLAGVVDVEEGLVVELGLASLVGEELLVVVTGEVGVEVVLAAPVSAAAAPIRRSVSAEKSGYGHVRLHNGECPSAPDACTGLSKPCSDTLRVQTE